MKARPPKIKTARDVINVIHARGLGIGFDPGPPKVPIIIRPDAVPREEVSDALLDAVAAWRLEIIADLERDYPAAADGRGSGSPLDLFDR